MILPLEVRGQESGEEYLGRQFAEWVAVNLASRGEGLTVLPVPEVGKPGGGGSEAQVRAAREQGAGRLLTGALTREGDVIRASLSLVDTSANRVLWGADREMAGEDLNYLAPELAREVATELGAVQPKLYDYWGNMTGNPELARSPLYLETLVAVRRWQSPPPPVVEGLLEAFPDEPDALSVAIYAFDIMRDRGRNEEPLRRAEARLDARMRLDPDAPWADYYDVFTKDELGSQGKVDLLTRLLERDDLTPSLRSHLLAERAHRQKKHEARLRDFAEALRLGHVTWDTYRNYAWALFNAGRKEEALVQARHAFAIDPHGNGVEWFLGQALLGTERWAEVVDHWGEACKPPGDQLRCVQVAYSLHRLERDGEAREAAEAAEGLEDSPDGTLSLAGTWVLIGDKAAAVRMLRRHVEVHPGPAPPFSGGLLRGNFGFSALVGDPEYEAFAAALWEKWVGYSSERCASDPNMARCGMLALASQVTGRESEARDAAKKAVSFEQTLFGCQVLAWYHGVARNREGVVRYMTCMDELGLRGFDFSIHRDYLWLQGDPEFDAVTARIARPKGEE
jgi:tetratricopeptide (TPR) repeat protein